MMSREFQLLTAVVCREIIELDSLTMTFLSAESDEPGALDDKISAQAAQG